MVYTCVQVEGAAAGVVEVTGVHACVLQRKHAESCWSHYSRHEHSTALYEGPWQPHPRLVFRCVQRCFLREVLPTRYFTEESQLAITKY